MKKAKKFLAIFLMIAVFGWLIASSLKVEAFTTSDDGFSNNSPTGTGSVVPDQRNVLLLDFNLPDPNADATTITGTAPSAGTAISATTSETDWSALGYIDASGGGAWDVAADTIFIDNDGDDKYGIESSPADLVIAGITPVATTTQTGDGVRDSDWTYLTTYDAASGGVWSSTTDWIGLDSDLSGYYQGDKFYSILINNLGDAASGDILIFKVWVEDGTNAGFQVNEDTHVGSGTAFNTAITTSTDPGVYTSTSKDRMYVTADISPTATINRTILAQVPAAVDAIVLVSMNDGPSDSSFSAASLRISGGVSVVDSIAPQSFISIPEPGQSIPIGIDYTISGYSTDSGGSNVKEVKVSLDGGITWKAATPLLVYDNGFTWKYIWESPAEGVYSIRTRAEDHIGNTESPGAGIEITVGIIEEVPEVVEEVPEVVEEVPIVVIEKPISEMTIDELQAKITEILNSINQIKEQLVITPSFSEIPSDFTFNNALKLGITGDEIKYLQIVLNSDTDTQLSVSGIGSSGNETTYFGNLTKSAVIKFQNKYASEILTSWGLTKGTGFVGSTTRAKLNELLGK